MGIRNQDSEGQAQPGRRPTFDSLLAADDGKSRSREGFVIRPVEILHLMGLPGEAKYQMQIKRAADRYGIKQHQWSSRKGYLPEDAGVIFRHVAKQNGRTYRYNRAHWYELDMFNAARDLGDTGITFTEAGRLIGIPPPDNWHRGDYRLLPFGIHPKQKLYDWIRQPIAHIDEVRKEYES